jgi:hypothetical protein
MTWETKPRWDTGIEVYYRLWAERIGLKIGFCEDGNFCLGSVKARNSFTSWVSTYHECYGMWEFCVGSVVWWAVRRKHWDVIDSVLGTTTVTKYLTGYSVNDSLKHWDSDNLSTISNTNRWDDVMAEHHLIATIYDLFLSLNRKCRGTPVEEHCNIQWIELWFYIILILNCLHIQKNSQLCAWRQTVLPIQTSDHVGSYRIVGCYGVSVALINILYHNRMH